MSSALIKFYLGNGRPLGMTFVDVISADNEFWDGCHDFIQWIFPLREPSQYNLDAPLLSEEDIKAFKRDNYLKFQVDKAFARFVSFLGFAVDYDSCMVLVDPWWITKRNHNMLRISRALYSLRLIGRSDLSDLLYNSLNALSAEQKEVIGAITWQYWDEAHYNSIDAY